MTRRSLDFLNPRRGMDVDVTRGLRFPSPTGAGVLPPMPGAPTAPGRVTSANAAPSKQVVPPWTQKIPGSVDFNANDDGTALAAVVGATVAVASFTLPEGQVGWLQQFFAYVRNQTNTTRVQFTVRINDGPVSGFDNVLTFPGVANIVILTHNSMQVRIPRGRVDILITNLVAQAEVVGGKLAGWYHPRDSELSYWGQEL